MKKNRHKKILSLIQEYNIDHTVRYCLEEIPEDKLIGMAVAPWCGTTTERNKYGFFKSFAETREAIRKYAKGGKF